MGLPNMPYAMWVNITETRCENSEQAPFHGPASLWDGVKRHPFRRLALPETRDLTRSALFQTASLGTWVNKGETEGRAFQRLRLSECSLSPSESAHVLQRDVTGVARILAEAALSPSAGLERPLHVRGARAGVRGEVESCSASDVRGGHGGAALRSDAPSPLRREDADPWRPDVHALAVVAERGLAVHALGACGRGGGSDDAVTVVVVDDAVAVGVCLGETRAAGRVVAGRLSLVACGYRVEDAAGRGVPDRVVQGLVKR